MSSKIDTKPGDKLPESPHKKRAKENKQAQTPPAFLPAFPCVFTEETGYSSVTEAGETLLKTLAQLSEAAQSAEGRARWEAWQLLETEVWSLRRGNVPLALDLSAQPLLHVAAQAVSAWIDSFNPPYLPEGQSATKPSGEAKT